MCVPIWVLSVNTVFMLLIAGASGRQIDALGDERRALLLVHDGDGLHARRVLLVERDLRDAGHVGGDWKRQVDDAGHARLQLRCWV